VGERGAFAAPSSPLLHPEPHFPRLAMSSSSHLRRDALAHVSSSDLDDDDDGSPSTFVAPVVLFEGPHVSMYPELARRIFFSDFGHAGSKELKVLDNEEFDREPRRMSDYHEPALVRFECDASEPGPSDWRQWSINVRL
jgi:hypothetical protein